MGSTSPNKRTSKSGTPLVGSPFSDPGLPSLSSSPQRYFVDRTLSLDSFSAFENEQQQQQQQQHEPERSTSFNETEVVLDDGSLIKRTVSLSTLPDQQVQDEQEGSVSRRSDSPNDTTPLLKSHKDIYHSIKDPENGTLSSSSSTSSSDTDSDDPFFPIKSTKTRRSKTHNVIEDDDETSSCWSHFLSFLTNLYSMIELTPSQRLVLKCSFAYFLGSLFTFIPALNKLIGNNHTSSHLVATATVFFNPAKSLGGMVEAAAYGWGYVVFGVLMALGSMTTTDFFVDRNYYTIAHCISLFFWLAGSTAVISFLKAHWNKPPVATASSLCFIIVFIIIVCEGSTNRGDFDISRIQQITSAVATGTFITVACCILFWPISAAKKLRTDLSATLGSYRVLLKLLTKTFLLDDDLPEFKANRTLQTAIEAHQGSFTALQKSLKEAKLETFWNNEVRGRSNEYDMIVKSMQRLAQHMGGLRSSCGIQFEMMGSEATQRYKEMTRKKRLNASFKAASNALFFTSSVSRSIKINNKTSNQNAFDRLSKSYIPPSNLDMPDQSWNVRPGYRRRKLQDEMRRQKTMFFKSDDDFGLLRNNSYTNRDVGSSSDHQHQTLNNQTEQTNSNTVTTDAGESGTALFDFIQTIRSPMKSLAYTCKQTLYHLQANFDPVTKKGAWYYYPNSSSRSIPSMEMLKKNLEKAISIFETAQKQAVAKLYRQRMKQTGDPSDISSIFSEDVFLVYFFVFNMTEFANELITMVNAVNKLNEAGQKPISLFTWLVQSIKEKLKGSDKEPHHRVNHARGIPFTPNERNTVNTLHTPKPKTKWRRFFIKIWRAFSLFKLQKVRYATKATVATVILATPAYLEQTSEWFREWRMEWALITLMVVMTPTVGGTNQVAIYRIFSTILGCYVAMAFYMLFPGNMYILPIVTWLFSIPNFWIILNNKHGKFGQFTLLAYNLVMLNKYNDRETNKIDVWLLATQRCLAILVGVIFGLIVTAYVWPYEARVELRKGLSDFLLRIGWLYQKLVSLYSDNPSNKTNMLDEQDIGPNPSETQLLAIEAQRKLTSQSFMDLELGLQRALLDLQALLSQTPNEPRLKGPFPVGTYRNMLLSCQNIVDRFLSMRTVISKDVWHDQVQRDFVVPLAHERKEMVGNVLLYFYLLASALRLKTPMPPYFPPAKKAWQNLIANLRKVPVVTSKRLLEKDNVYIYYYAYVTLMEDVIRELDKLGDNMTQLFGSLIPTDQWEMLFDEEAGQQLE